MSEGNVVDEGTIDVAIIDISQPQFTNIHFELKIYQLSNLVIKNPSIDWFGTMKKHI